MSIAYQHLLTAWVSEGLDWGDPISPKLCISPMEELVNKIKDDYGININGRKYLLTTVFQMISH